jgi:multidrug efflux system outer membrane protein
MVSLGAVASCAVGPNYSVPKNTLPAHWSVALEGGEANSPIAIAEWWKNFNDPQLDEFIETAIRQNLSVRAAEDRVREARAERDAVVGARLPSVDAELAYSRNHFSKNAFPTLPPGTALSYNLFSVGFDADWEVDLFGGIHRAVEASNAEVTASEYASHDVLLTIVAEVARNYIDARANQQLLLITKQSIAAEQNIADMTQSLFQGGLASDLDVEQSTALLAATKSRVPELETALTQSIHRVAVLLGTSADALQTKMSEAGLIPITPPQVPVGLPSDLLRRRPDVQRAERELAAATAQIGMAKADLFPKLSLTGFIGDASTESGNWLEYASRTGSIGPSLRWKLFDGDRLRAKVRVQEARSAGALDNYQLIVLSALAETESALVAYAKEQTHRQLLEQSQEASQTSFDLSSQLYRSGLIDFLKVLDAERTLYASQEAVIESTSSVSLDLVRLYKALGGGWERDGEIVAKKP